MDQTLQTVHAHIFVNLPYSGGDGILLFDMIADGNFSADYADGMVEQVCACYFITTIFDVWVVRRVVLFSALSWFLFSLIRPFQPHPFSFWRHHMH